MIIITMYLNGPDLNEQYNVNTIATITNKQQ